MHTVSIHEAKTHLSRLIKEVLNGEEVIIAKRNKPLVKLIIYTENTHKRKIGTAKGLVKIEDDFDKPLEEFQEYM